MSYPKKRKNLVILFMYIEYPDIVNPITFCIDVILKEAKEEDRVVKQIYYAMLSAYTNNPVNLAINSPSGEGKTYVILKVGDLFPQQDIMFLAGMTDKALFHRGGTLVVKNESGEYESIDDMLEQIVSDVEDKEQERVNTKDKNLKQGLQSQIENLEKEKRELLKDAKKLIDLSHKVLVFLDSPRPELFNALMPLLSHDKYEVEYEFVDTNNGIKTKTNVLRGWPAVIFAQAIDYSHYIRYPEIQRRFIITNPKMDKSKYEQAVDLILDKFGLPDFAYQTKVVSDSDKEKVRQIILGIREKIQDICHTIEPGKNNVIIPFNELLKRILRKEKASDMTYANRFGAILSLLAIINIDKRPRLVSRREGSLILQIIPFALFEDLREATYLLEYANGVRPYILEWYNDVFLATYNDKTVVDSKINNRGEEIAEKRKALTSRELIDKITEIYNKKISTKQLLQTYITPLINENYIDSSDSELDRRAHVYFPVLENIKYDKLFPRNKKNNISQYSRIIISDPIQYPDKKYVIFKIQEILKYSSNDFLIGKIKDHKGNDITVEELVDQYYADYENYFELKCEVSEEYHPNSKIASESRENKKKDEESIQSSEEQSKNVSHVPERNNFLYSCNHDDCDFQTNDELEYQTPWRCKPHKESTIISNQSRVREVWLKGPERGE